MDNNLENLLSILVAINSTYPNEKKIGEYIYNFFKAKRYTAIKQKVSVGRYNILVQKGSGKKTVALYAHIDTVHVTEGWKTNPFVLTKKRDKAYGLGAFDMKSGLVVAIQTFLETNLKNTKLQLLLCVDEENISQGGFHLYNSGLLKNIDCFVSLEPALQYGLQGIVTGRIGRAVFEVTLRRKSLHYIYYNSRVDLNLLAAKVIQRLEKLNIIRNKERKQFIFVRNIQSSAVGMSLPQEVHLELDSSILPPQTNEGMLSAINEILEETVREFSEEILVRVNLKKRTTPFLSSYEVDKNNNYLQMLKQSVRRVLHKQPITYFRSSVADENVLALTGKPVFCIGVEGENAHGPNEWVSMSSVGKLQNILMDFLSTLDAS